MKKKILLAVLSVIVSFTLHAQPDTNLYQTATAQNVATWLQNLSLSSGTGHVSVLTPSIGGSAIMPSSRSFIDANGMVAYYANTSMVNNDLNTAAFMQRDYFRNAGRAGAYMARSPVFISWGIVEPAPGNFHYEFIDTTVKIAGEHNIQLLGTLCPFADWSQACNPVITGCQLFANQDLFFINNDKAGPVCDTAAYFNFIQQTVERYDGDGVNDMPGLTIPITFWEFGNEPDGNCTSYYPNDPQGYVRDLRITYQAMKAACPSCIMLNGGQGLYDSSGTSSGLAFWNAIIDSGYQYINIANVHSNDGKTLAPFQFNKMLNRHLDIFHNKSNQYNLDWETWVTEWGIYSHAPQSLPYRSEEQQASLYTKIYCWSLANNVTNYFYDLNGDTLSGIGSSALIERQGTPIQSFARLFFYTQKLYEYKFRDYDSVNVMLFDTSTNFPVGDVRFYKSAKTYYVMWGVNSLPPGLSGVKTITDIYGNIQTINLSSLTLPLGSNPIIIEDSVATSVNGIANNDSQVTVYPNPNNGTFYVTSNKIAQPGNIKVQLYNPCGKIIFATELKPDDFIRIPNADDGIYFLRITSENNTAMKKVLIVK